jgi:hypothetical protein
LTVPASSTVGTLATAAAPNYATLTADAANDAMMTVTGTPNAGITAGEILGNTPVLLPGVIETCEAVPGQGTLNPAAGNALTKSTNVFFAGAVNTNVTALVGHTFTAYYEDCLRDGGTPIAAGTHSSITIDATGSIITFDSRTGASNTVKLASSAATGTLALVGPTGLNGRFLVPYFYILNGTFHQALVEHGVPNLTSGTTKNYVGVWLEQ